MMASRSKIHLKRFKINAMDYSKLSMESIRFNGGLLCTVDKKGRPNIMTIGWLLSGVAWYRPVLSVFVRKLRKSYFNLEESGEFTVNIVNEKCGKLVHFCGEITGHKVDKLKYLKVGLIPSETVQAPTLQKSVISYECKTIQVTDVPPAYIHAQEDLKLFDPNLFWRAYFGEVTAAYAVRNPEKYFSRWAYPL